MPTAAGGTYTGGATGARRRPSCRTSSYRLRNRTPRSEEFCAPMQPSSHHGISRTAMMPLLSSFRGFYRYLAHTVRLVGIGPTDIVDGNATSTLGMIWSLIVFFMARDVADSGDGLTALKQRCNPHVARKKPFGNHGNSPLWRGVCCVSPSSGNLVHAVVVSGPLRYIITTPRTALPPVRATMNRRGLPT